MHTQCWIWGGKIDPAVEKEIEAIDGVIKVTIL